MAVRLSASDRIFPAQISRLQTFSLNTPRAQTSSLQKPQEEKHQYHYEVSVDTEAGVTEEREPKVWDYFQTVKKYYGRLDRSDRAFFDPLNAAISKLDLKNFRQHEEADKKVVENTGRLKEIADKVEYVAEADINAASIQAAILSERSPEPELALPVERSFKFTATAEQEFITAYRAKSIDTDNPDFVRKIINLSNKADHRRELVENVPDPSGYLAKDYTEDDLKFLQQCKAESSRINSGRLSDAAIERIDAIFKKVMVSN